MTPEEQARLTPALDRLQEAHFWLHGIEAHYHDADPLRWYLNAFLRALKEVPDIVSMGLQNRPGFPEWFATHRAALAQDPLIAHLSEQRDVVVHRGLLLPKSAAFLEITEGRGLKLAIGRPIDPMIDSDAEMHRYLQFASKEKDFLGLLDDDEDSLPCIERRWRLDDFPDTKLSDLCANAWLTLAKVVGEVVRELKGPEFAPDLSCRHSLSTVRFRVYSRDHLRQGRVEGFYLPSQEA